VQGFALGIYDGLSGIVMDPIRGGIKDGAAGVAKGFGTGLMSSWWKTSAGKFLTDHYTKNIQ
jgi:hypothetical protein